MSFRSNSVFPLELWIVVQVESSRFKRRIDIGRSLLLQDFLYNRRVLSQECMGFMRILIVRSEPDDDVRSTSIYRCHHLHLTTPFIQVALVNTYCVYP